jgi:hypothetical protein
MRTRKPCRFPARHRIGSVIKKRAAIGPAKAVPWEHYWSAVRSPSMIMAAGVEHDTAILDRKL